MHHGTLGALFGTLVFDYEQDTFSPAPATIRLRWTSQGNGQYLTELQQVTAGSDCPQLERNLGPKLCPVNGGPTLHDPVNVSTGNRYQDEVDYQGSGSLPLSFHRHYNSTGPGDGGIGIRWSHTFDRLLTLQSSTEVKLKRATGEILYFQKCAASWCATADETGTLIQATNTNGYTTGWQYTDENAVIEEYNGAGQFVAETSRDGLGYTVSYDTSGRLSTVADSHGRQLRFAYDTSGRINRLTEPSGATVTYTYDASGNLRSATYPDTTSRTYLYDESGFVGSGAASHLLTGIQDKSNQRFTTFKYLEMSNPDDAGKPAARAARCSPTTPMGRHSFSKLPGPPGFTRSNRCRTSVTSCR